MKYLLLSSRRSGSALLKHSLVTLFSENTDGPDEWIVNINVRKKLGLPDNFDSANAMVLNNPQLLIDRMSPNSHRKVMYSQILSPSNIPENVSIIHLIRRDAWSQAKSSWVMSQKFLPAHADEKKFKELSENNISLDLDLKEIERQAKNFLFQKHFWYQSLKNRPKTLTLFYEDDLQNINVFTSKTLPKIERFLNKKSMSKNFNFSLKKTSKLYDYNTINKDEEQLLINEYNFDSNKIKPIDFIKVKLKQILQ